MSDNSPYRRRVSLVRPLGLAACGGAVLAVAIWLGWTNGGDVKLPPAGVTVAESAKPVMPAAPVAAAQAPQAAGTPSFDIVRVNPAGDAVVAGRAAPGASVTIADNGKEIGRTVADAQGQFVFLPSAPLPAGGQELTLTAHQKDGSETKGMGPVVVLVPDRATTPAIASATGPDAAPRTAIAVLTPPDAAPRVLQGPESGPGSKLGLAVVDYDSKGDIRFAGNAPPGSVVRVYVDNHAIGDARSDAQGHWTMTPGSGIAAGDHALRLDQLASSGKVETRIELPFQRAVIAEQDVPQDRVVVQPQQNLWRIARRAYGRGVMFTEIYRANRNQIRDPNLIFPGQVFAIPAPGSALSASVGPAKSTPSASITSR